MQKLLNSSESAHGIVVLPSPTMIHSYSSLKLNERVFPTKMACMVSWPFTYISRSHAQLLPLSHDTYSTVVEVVEQSATPSHGTGCRGCYILAEINRYHVD